MTAKELLEKLIGEGLPPDLVPPRGPPGVAGAVRP
jgi:hypothetical protein